jgi:hypothetical protein
LEYALKPLTVGELLDRTFSFYRRHFLLFVGIAALPNLFVFALQLMRMLVGTEAVGLVGTLIWFLVVMLGAFVAWAFSHGATIVAVSRIQLGREINVSEAFASIRPKLGELILVILNMSVRITLGLLLLIVPGIILALMYALAVPVAVLEDKGVSGSLTRSAQLTKGHRGRIFLIYFLLLVLIQIVAMLWQVPAMLLLVFFRGGFDAGQVSTIAQLIVLLGSFVSQSVLGPIMTIALSLVYYDERVRKEAFDLEHMMQQLDASTLAASPTR